MGGVVLFESALGLWDERRDVTSRRIVDADLVGVRVVDGKVNVVKDRHGVVRTVSEEQFAAMRLLVEEASS